MPLVLQSCCRGQLEATPLVWDTKPWRASLSAFLANLALRSQLSRLNRLHAEARG